MRLEESIKSAIEQKMEDGTIERLIQQELEKGIKGALESLFRSYGDVGKLIEDQIKSVMVPYLESYDFSKYIVKLDAVLVEVLKETALENKKVLNNFKSLMAMPDRIKQIKTSEIFDKWCSYVKKNVDTSNLEVDFDDEPAYETVECTMSVEYEDVSSWSSFEYAKIVLECKKDDKMNAIVYLSKWEGRAWSIRYDISSEIKSLRHMDEFNLFLAHLNQSLAEITIDTEDEHEWIRPEAEPEATFS